ncbi:MAG: CRISPR-associated endonuclease Cas3'' [Pseudomonadota bacterium]|nr:CRISPR-associated endonuclease Cas3'' [Pseudomonadota bacterium]
MDETNITTNPDSKSTDATPRVFAHSLKEQPTSYWQPLSAHLSAVGTLAAEFAQAFGAGDMARVTGLLHDLGKYTREFQAHISGQTQHVDHASRGAIVALERYGPLGQLMAYAIAGHHAGLADGQWSADSQRTALAQRLDGSGLPALLPDWQREITLPDHIAPPTQIRPRSKDFRLFSMAFFGRMLFSCLVDADFLDTESFYAAWDSHRTPRRPPSEASDLPPLRAALDAHLHAKQQDARPTPLNATRARILHEVRSRAALAPGLFSLTVPTGGGKTLASMAFALDHAVQHGLRRVIQVIPFTSIVEQNAKVFRDAFGELGDAAVLEHHSAFADDPRQAKEARDKLRLAMENWDAPVIVTTAVQFFESLFGDRPAQCRKLHRIAGSVIVLDEAQTIPLPLLRPTLAALDELARNYRCSIVFCTATQPALSDARFSDLIDQPRELAPEPEQLFNELRRVTVRHEPLLSDEQLAERLRASPQALCIVNNRQHARALYELLRDSEGVRHLTTLMCAEHRTQVLNDIRARLTASKPCRVVSTSLIEAGVDVSFPLVLRAEAGIDSIAQAAGRCNREGLWQPQASEVLVFGVDPGQWKPPPVLKQCAEVAKGTLRRFKDDPLQPAAIQHYFEELYWSKGIEALDEKDLLGLLRESQLDSLPFETLKRLYRLIDNAQLPIIVPFDDTARNAINELRFATGAFGIARKLQRYTVQVPRKGHDALLSAGAIQTIAPEKWGSQFMVLVNPSLYDDHCGLTWDNPVFMKSEQTVI